MSFRLSALSGLGLLLLALQAQALIIRIPVQLPTIQSGLDNIQSGDTLLISPGVYEEALIGPDFPFTMIGDVDQDTTMLSNPMVDPSSIPRSDTMACLMLSSNSQVWIEYMTFRNRWTMREGRDQQRIGGINNQAASLSIRNCLFDSCHTAVGGYCPTVITDHSEFRGCHNSCVIAQGYTLRASNCRFNGNGWSLVWCGDGSTVENCLFTGNQDGHLLNVSSSDIAIRNCRFGPSGPQAFAPLQVIARGDISIRGCVFSELQLGIAAIQVDVLCDVADPLPVEIVGNQFFDNTSVVLQGGQAIYLRCSELYDRGLLARVDSNEFRDSETHNSFANVVWSTSRFEFNHNFIENMQPDATPDVFQQRTSDTLQSIARNNRFEEVGQALTSALSSFDARFNWWGDESGPTHSSNPGGSGGAISDLVLYDPWLTDTTDSMTSVQPHPQALPENFEAPFVFPNPANNSFMFRIPLAFSGTQEISVYNLAGQLVHSQIVKVTSESRDISFTPVGLSTGIYFLRLKDIDSGAFTLPAKFVLLK